jgi:hypothetical protein
MIFEVATTAIFSSLLATAALFTGVKETARQCALRNNEIQQFYFEDCIKCTIFSGIAIYSIIATFYTPAKI